MFEDGSRQPVLIVNPINVTVQDVYRSPLDDDYSVREDAIDQRLLLDSCSVAIPERNGRKKGWKQQPMEDLDY